MKPQDIIAKLQEAGIDAQLVSRPILPKFMPMNEPVLMFSTEKTKLLPAPEEFKGFKAGELNTQILEYIKYDTMATEELREQIDYLKQKAVQLSQIPPVFIDYNRPQTGSVITDEQCESILQEIREFYSEDSDVGRDNHNDHFDALRYSSRKPTMDDNM